VKEGAKGRRTQDRGGKEGRNEREQDMEVPQLPYRSHYYMLTRTAHYFLRTYRSHAHSTRSPSNFSALVVRSLACFVFLSFTARMIGPKIEICEYLEYREQGPFHFEVPICRNPIASPSNSHVGLRRASGTSSGATFGAAVFDAAGAASCL
jgi:hypothetical protein